MIFRSKLFLLLVLVVAVSVYAQKKGKGKGKDKGKGNNNNAILSSSNQCSNVIRNGGPNSPQFAILCRVTDITNSVLPALQNLTASQVCDLDCRCVMGARAGGTCGTSPVDGQTYCRCDYQSKATSSPYNLLCQTVFPIVTNTLCPPLPIIGGLVNNTVCVNDCVCSHGFDPKQTHQCTTQNGVKGNKINYCVCNQAKNQ